MRSRHQRYSRNAGFTLVEIAICLGIIGFALVAIIGILPAGLQVQRDNREDTIINQEGAYLIEAIRSGAEGLDDLTNRIDRGYGIWYWDAAGNGPPSRWGKDLSDPGEWDTAREVVGYLSTPTDLLLPSGEVVTNEMRAVLRASVGAAGDSATEVAFKYQVRIRNYAYRNSSPSYTREFRDELANNFRELRLEFRWPVLPNGNVGAGRQIFRANVAGSLVEDPLDSGFYFFRQ